MPRFIAIPSHTPLRACRTLAAGVAAMFGVVLTANSALAAGLMDPLTTSEQESASATVPVAPYARSERLARVDLNYLNANFAPRGIDKARDRLRQAPAAGSVRIDLLPGVSVTLDREALRKARGGGFIWSGNVRGGNGGFADLVISNDQITGQIQVGNRVFRIAPVVGAADGTIHRISEIDGSKFPDDIAVPAPTSSPRNGSVENTRQPGTPLANPEATTVVRVLMPYTAQARIRVGAINQAANLAIRLANRALRSSDVNARFKLVGTIQVKRYYEPGKKYLSTLRAVSKGKKMFAAIADLRDRKKADLVAMFRTGSELCGIAWYNSNPNSDNARYGFSVSNVDCITNHVVAHEMGHNAGLLHDRYVTSPKPPSSEYNFGYVNLGARIISVMAYDYRCYIKGVSCTRVAMYSTPREKYLGAKIGIAKGKPGAADAARRLGETLPGVASFR